MKVKVRTIDGQLKVLEVSKAMLVQDFRKKVQEAVGIEPKKQRLLFRGKQLENGCDLLDYRIEIGTIIDVIERVVQEEVDTNSAKKGKDGKKEDDPPKFSEEREPGNYQIAKLFLSSMLLIDDPENTHCVGGGITGHQSFSFTTTYLTFFLQLICRRVVPF